ncbi:hypothetical protein EU799_10635 [Corynebacterium silvaticum]|uniref:hypothetical protein n=1 Tax=Corynebacterium silvaticum TaxID=2320431 RepID=UPI0010683E7B|nr:hypothetical protein [Corynebacterium silvaticum]MBH5299848.1 hypothetical protein [Corynebacterium silvaticum]NOM65740.1 hypothetical protein [Corynebacterium silvaticum]TFA91554.1 hypothetical protein EU802_10355 [Corynebacterium silvaticum]TFA92584.1 hypothetical protein EU799_10635 [Corynebacterium silvaticum]TNX78725.1 hypothetical protein FIT55_11065 [Corynebacterium silvaticum]
MTTKTKKTDSDDAVVVIGGQPYELILTTRATREIAARYGGLENLGEALESSEDFAHTLGEVIWLITLLANQSVAIHNLQHPDDPRSELTVEAVELLTVPADLADYRGAIAAALQHGTRRAIETVSVPKDPAKDA